MESGFKVGVQVGYPEQMASINFYYRGGGGGIVIYCPVDCESGQYVHMNCDPGVRGYGNQYHMTSIKRQK